MKTRIQVEVIDNQLLYTPQYKNWFLWKSWDTFNPSAWRTDSLDKAKKHIDDEIKSNCLKKEFSNKYIAYP